MLKANKLFYYLFFLILTNNSMLFAAEGDPLESVMGAMIFLTIILVAFVLWANVVYSEKNDNDGRLFLKPLHKVRQALTKSTPLERENEILMAHNYDGIRELDNKIPPWFSLLFYGTILFGIIYMIQYHVIGSGQVQEEEYIEEIRLAEAERHILIKSGAFLNEETVTLTTDAGALSNGKSIYDKNCASCHGFNGEGLVGPNLTDEYWIHGGGIKNVFSVVKYGVPQKGMISWQTQLSPTQIQEVGSYIISLLNSNPPNAKPPEGEKWEEAPPESES